MENKLVAVTGRNRTLFSCIFWSHCCVRSALALNFCKGWAHMRCVNVVSVDEFTQHVWAPPLTEISRERFKHSNASKIRNGIMFDFYPDCHAYCVITTPLYPPSQQELLWTQTSVIFSSKKVMFLGYVIDHICNEIPNQHFRKEEVLIQLGKSHQTCRSNKPTTYVAVQQKGYIGTKLDSGLSTGPFPANKSVFKA